MEIYDQDAVQLSHDVYTVYDGGLQIFRSIFTANTPNEAVQIFADSISGTEIQRSLGDFWLYKIGKFNINSGEIDKIPPQRFVNAHQVYNERQSNGEQHSKRDDSEILERPGRGDSTLNGEPEPRDQNNA